MFRKYPKTKLVLLAVGLLLVVGWLIQIPPPWAPRLHDWFLQNLGLPEDEVPLREDGRVDFLALLEREKGAGVNVDNNWAVHLFQIMRPEGSPAAIARLREKLGNPGAAPVSPLLNFSEFVSQQIEQHPEGDAGELEDAMWELVGVPWQGDDQLAVRDWLAEQQETLDYFASGRDKPRWYYPVMQEETEGPLIMNVILPQLVPVREMARNLAVRAMNHLGEGRLEACLDDVAVIRQLAFQMRGSGMVIDELLATALSGIASHCEQAALSTGTWTPALCDQYRAVVEATTWRGDLSQCLAGERLATLDAVQAIASGKVGPQGGGFATPGAPLLQMRALVDWPTVAATCDRRFQEMVEAARGSEEDGRATAIADWAEALEAEWQEISQPSKAIPRLLAGARSRGRVTGEMLCSTLLPSMSAVEQVSMRSRAFGMTVIGLELERIRIEEGQFPESLEGLPKELLETWGQDPFTGQRLFYQRLPDGYVLYSLGPDRNDVTLTRDRREIPAEDRSPDDDIRLRVVRDPSPVD